MQETTAFATYRPTTDTDTVQRIKCQDVGHTDLHAGNFSNNAVRPNVPKRNLVADPDVMGQPRDLDRLAVDAADLSGDIKVRNFAQTSPSGGQPAQ